MNDHVINQLHMEFCVSILVMFFGLLLVPGEWFQIMYGSKSHFLFQLVLYFQVQSCLLVSMPGGWGTFCIS